MGGPCRTKDPYFYALVAERAGVTDTLAVQGRKVNERIPVEIAERVVSILADNGVAPDAARVLVVGLAFKGWPETSDVRNSSSLIMVERLRSRGVKELRGVDPVVPAEELSRLGLTVFPTERWKEGFRGCHAVLFMNNHPSYRKWDIYEGVRLMNRPAILFDGWQVFDELLRTVAATLDGMRGTVFPEQAVLTLDGVGAERFVLFLPADAHGAEVTAPWLEAVAGAIRSRLEDTFEGESFRSMAPRLRFQVGQSLLQDVTRGMREGVSRGFRVSSHVAVRGTPREDPGRREETLQVGA